MDTFTIGELAIQYVILGGKDPRAARIVEKVRREDRDPRLLTEASEVTLQLIDELVGVTCGTR